MALTPKELSPKLKRLDEILAKMDVLSGQGPVQDAVINVAALLKHHAAIEKALGEKVSDGDYFELMASRVMRGGAVILTDESTTGHVVEVEFSKKVRF